MRAFDGHTLVSTHSRPKAAEPIPKNAQPTGEFQHTAARRRLGLTSPITDFDVMFQHTAARRRLNTFPKQKICPMDVSTHSRPKAADA